MKGSTVSRRVSEFVGVALFAAALIWIIALASYEPTDPVWFFSTGVARRAGELRRPRRRVPRRAVVPAVRLRRVPHPGAAGRASAGTTSGAATVDAAGTKADRRGAALRLRQRVPQPRLRHARRVRASRSARAATSATGSPAQLSDYLNRTGSVIVILTLIVPGGHHVDAVLVRPPLRRDLRRPRGDGGARASASFREWREERRREQQRREVIAKHTKKGGAAAGDQGAAADAGRAPTRPRPPRKRAGRRRADPAPRRVGSAEVVRAAQAAEGQRAAAAAAAARSRAGAKAPAERRKGEYTLPPLALLDAPKTERKIDERELMDGARLLEEKCREFAVEGTRRADSSRARSSRPSSSSPTPA